MLEIPAWKAFEAIDCPPCTGEGAGVARGPGLVLVSGLSQHANSKPGGTSGSPDLGWVAQMCAMYWVGLFLPKEAQLLWGRACLMLVCVKGEEGKGGRGAG